MKNVADTLKDKLFSLIDEVSKVRMLYVNNPEKDFTRERKLSFRTCSSC